MNRFEDNKYFREDSEGAALKRRMFGRDGKRRSPGIILAFLFAISDRFFKALGAGFFGYLFSSLYTKINQKWRGGGIFTRLKGRTAEIRLKKNQIHASFLKKYEGSMVCSLIERTSDSITSSMLRVWGAGLFTFSFVSIFAALLHYYFTSELLGVNLIFGVAVAIISIPLVVSKKRLGEALFGSKLTNYVITSVLNMDESHFECDESKPSGSYGLSLTISVILGVVTFFVNPILVLGGIIAVVAFLLIMCFPELGIMAVLGLIPFSSIFERPSLAMLVLVLFTFASYISKLIRRKRVIKFEFIDIMVIGFGLIVLLGGIVSHGGKASFMSAAMYCAFMMIYVLIVNSYIRKTWIYRGIKLIVLSNAAVSIIGLFEDGVISSSYVDMSVFSDIGARISSFLGNPNMLGVYLVIVFPLALGQMINSRRIINKFLYGICALAILACTVMTWSRGAWLGLIIAFLVMLVICNTKSIWLIVAAVATVPVWAIYLPSSIINRFMSILSMSDSSVIYRFNTWAGVLRMIGDHWIGGIGVGEDAFRTLWGLYALPGTESVMHSHNLLLEITLSVGVVGLIVFVVAIVAYVQKCFVGMRGRKSGSKSRTMIAAGFSGILGALVMGLTDYIWYNYRVFLIFWAVIALTVALSKINANENAKREASVQKGIRSADLDIYC